MNRLAQPAADQHDLELFCLAASAVNDCEACIHAHERALVGADLTEDQVHDAIRIAATLHAAAVALGAVSMEVDRTPTAGAGSPGP